MAKEGEGVRVIYLGGVAPYLALVGGTHWHRQFVERRTGHEGWKQTCQEELREEKS